MMSYRRQLDMDYPSRNERTNLTEIVPISKGNIHSANHIFIAHQHLSHTYTRKYTPSG